MLDSPRSPPESERPVLWATGTSSDTDCAAVREGMRGARVLRLSALGPERALAELLGGLPERITTERLLAFARRERRLVLAGLEVVQLPDREILDPRVRQLLFAVAAGTMEGVRVMVRSELGPPPRLPAQGLSVLTPAAPAVRAPAAPSTDATPEGRVGRLVDQMQVDEAIQVYWKEIGNFARLDSLGLHASGMHLCHLLNGRRGPEVTSPALSATGGAWAILNDWSQFARCLGDAMMCARAASAAYHALPPSRPAWDFAQLAAHVAEGELAAGNMSEAMFWGERAWEHARRGTRANQGISTREVIEAYDWSAATMARIYLRLERPDEIRRLMDDLAAIHTRARQALADFNAESVFSVRGPTGTVDPDALVDGRLAAMLALAEGAPSRIPRSIATGLSPAAERDLAFMRLRAELADGGCVTRWRSGTTPPPGANSPSWSPWTILPRGSTSRRHGSRGHTPAVSASHGAIFN